MTVIQEAIEAPLDRGQLAQRWQALCADPSFEDLAAKVELTEWGEILMSPVGKIRGLAAARVAEALRLAVGGRVMVEVGVATRIGVRAPDVAWCSERYLAAHPEDAPLTSAPELCIEIVSSNQALPKLREKAAAYIEAGATEAWILFPRSCQIEMYAKSGKLEQSSFAVDAATLFD